MAERPVLRVENNCLVIPLELIERYSVRFDCTVVGLAAASFRCSADVHLQIHEACEGLSRRPGPFADGLE